MVHRGMPRNLRRRPRRVHRLRSPRSPGRANPQARSVAPEAARPIVDGRELHAAVVNEHAVRAAAGVTLVIGSVAFCIALFDGKFLPLQVTSVLFFVEFLVRTTAGFEYSPVGVLAHRMTRRMPPDWVSAKPKLFAWRLGLTLSTAMMVITNSGIRGLLPRTICLICMTLMWMETALGLCLGCEIHGRLVRRGWATKDPEIEVCAHSACELPSRPQADPLPNFLGADLRPRV